MTPTSLKEFSVESLPMIGAGANGRIYRIDEETIIKVYNPITNPPEKIFREKETARLTFTHGIPTAISFQIVRVKDSYGIIYEKIDGKTLSEVISDHPETLHEYAVKMAQMLKDLHNTHFEKGILPDARLGLHSWADVAEKSGYYPAESISLLREFIDHIPERDTFIHGDFHPANIMLHNDEMFLIDIGDASTGHPVIDLLGTYQIMKLATQRAGGARRYLSSSPELMLDTWDIFVREYFGIQDPEEIRKIEEKLRFYAIARSMAGVTFSDLLPLPVRKELSIQVNESLLAKVDSYLHDDWLLTW